MAFKSLYGPHQVKGAQKNKELQVIRPAFIISPGSSTAYSAIFVLYQFSISVQTFDLLFQLPILSSLQCAEQVGLFWSSVPPVSMTLLPRSAWYLFPKAERIHFWGARPHNHEQTCNLYGQNWFRHMFNIFYTYSGGLDKFTIKLSSNYPPIFL